ncbi:hypothetical protein BTE77_34610 [Ensifer adhaerens]|nr:hypothetical protein BTE77_34610 [Ensifer adhaerens]
MIDREHKLSVVRQAKLLGFSRGSVYYSPRPVSDGDLALMRRIDELHQGTKSIPTSCASWRLPDQSGLLGWTAPNGIAMCQNEFVESSIEGDRPWNKLSELV